MFKMEAAIAVANKSTSPRGNFTRTFLDELSARVDFAELVSRYVVLKPSGEGRFMGRCPFHQEKTASFSVNAAKGLYHCFGCGASGNVIGFAMEMEKLTFPDAVRQLAARVGMELPRAAEPPDPRWEALKLAQEFYQQRLKKAPANSPASLFLERRGITPEDVQNWGLGLAPTGWDELLAYLKSRGLNEKDLLNAGLIQTDTAKGRSWDRLRDRLIFPIRSSSGALLGFGGRTLGESDAKYLNTPETQFFHKKELLYGLDKARSEIVARGHALIVEGYLDVVAMHRVGQNQAVAPMGTAFSPEQAQLLLRFTDKVKLLYDRDEAGRKAQERTVEVLWESGLEVKISLLPAGLDPDDLVREQGKHGVAEVLLSGETPVQYFLNPDKSDITTRREYGKRLEAMLVKVSDTVYREALFDEYSQLIKVPKEHIKARSEAYRESREAPVVKTPVALRDKSDPSERLLCYLAAYDVRFAQDTARLLSVDEVGSELLRTMLGLIQKLLASAELDFEELKTAWEEQGLLEQLATLANDPKLRLKDGSDPYETLLEVKARSVRKKLDVLHSQMESSDSGKDMVADQLLTPAVELTKILNEIRLSKSDVVSARQALENIFNLMHNNGVK